MTLVVFSNLNTSRSRTVLVLGFGNMWTVAHIIRTWDSAHIEKLSVYLHK